MEAARREIVETKLAQLFGETVTQMMWKIELPSSRAERLNAAAELVEEAKTEVEELKTEIENWYDSLPDSFRDGEQGESMQETISSLEEIYDSLEGVDFSPVNFPRMRT